MCCGEVYSHRVKGNHSPALVNLSRLVSWIEHCPRAKAIVVSKLQKIVIALKTDDFIWNPRFGSNFFDIRIQQDGTLFFSTTIDNINWTGGWGRRVDEVLNLRVLDSLAMKRAVYSMSILPDSLEGRIGKKIYLEVNWDSFISHEKFLNKSDSQRRNIIENIPQFMSKALFWPNGYV